MPDYNSERQPVGTGRIFPVTDPGMAQQEFGQGANTVQVKYIDLSVAHDMHPVEFGGTMVWAYEASSLEAEIDVHFQEQSSGALTFKQGMNVRGMKYSRLYVTNEAQAGAWIELVLIRETFSNVNVENPAQSFTNITVRKDTTIETIADATVVAAAAAAIIVPADADRDHAIIRNNNTNAKTLRIGDTNTAAARGVSLLPGEVMTLCGTGAIYAYNPAGADETVSITTVGA